MDSECQVPLVATVFADVKRGRLFLWGKHGPQYKGPQSGWSSPLNSHFKCVVNREVRVNLNKENLVRMESTLLQGEDLFGPSIKDLFGPSHVEFSRFFGGVICWVKYGGMMSKNTNK